MEEIKKYAIGGNNIDIEALADKPDSVCIQVETPDILKGESLQMDLFMNGAMAYIEDKEHWLFRVDNIGHKDNIVYSHKDNTEGDAAFILHYVKDMEFLNENGVAKMPLFVGNGFSGDRGQEAINALIGVGKDRNLFLITYIGRNEEEELERIV